MDIVAKDGKITELKLNGAPIDENAVYEIAMLDGDFTEEFKNSHEITNSGTDVLVSLSDYFESKGTIKPDK